MSNNNSSNNVIVARAFAACEGFLKANDKQITALYPDADAARLRINARRCQATIFGGFKKVTSDFGTFYQFSLDETQMKSVASWAGQVQSIMSLGLGVQVLDMDAIRIRAIGE